MWRFWFPIIEIRNYSIKTYGNKEWFLSLWNNSRCYISHLDCTGHRCLSQSPWIWFWSPILFPKYCILEYPPLLYRNTFSKCGFQCFTGSDIALTGDGRNIRLSAMMLKCPLTVLRKGPYWNNPTTTLSSFSLFWLEPRRTEILALAFCRQYGFGTFAHNSRPRYRWRF